MLAVWDRVRSQWNRADVVYSLPFCTADFTAMKYHTARDSSFIIVFISESFTLLMVNPNLLSAGELKDRTSDGGWGSKPHPWASGEERRHLEELRTLTHCYSSVTFRLLDKYESSHTVHFLLAYSIINAQSAVFLTENMSLDVIVVQRLFFLACLLWPCDLKAAPNLFIYLFTYLKLHYIKV